MDEDLTKQKADMLARINAKASEWLDSVLHRVGSYDDGEHASLELRVSRAGYGPEPEEAALFDLAATEKFEETGL